MKRAVVEGSLVPQLGKRADEICNSVRFVTKFLHSFCPTNCLQYDRHLRGLLRKLPFLMMTLKMKHCMIERYIFLPRTFAACADG